MHCQALKSSGDKSQACDLITIITLVVYNLSVKGKVKQYGDLTDKWLPMKEWKK